MYSHVVNAGWNVLNVAHQLIHLDIRLDRLDIDRKILQRLGEACSRLPGPRKLAVVEELRLHAIS